MTTSHPPRPAAIDINRLRRGRSYRATTSAGEVAAGEYLGIEVAYDVWCILLRGNTSTTSIPTCEIVAIEPAPQVA